MKKILLVTVLLASLLVLSGCGETGIVGKWAYGSYVYTFNKDNTCSYSTMECTYTVDGDKLSILYKGNTAPFETTFRIEGKTLIIKDSFGNDVKYERQ